LLHAFGNGAGEVRGKTLFPDCSRLPYRGNSSIFRNVSRNTLGFINNYKFLASNSFKINGIAEKRGEAGYLASCIKIIGYNLYAFHENNLYFHAYAEHKSTMRKSDFH
jgi:hypothetical protein